jgi:hypothetical protein
MKAKPGEIMGYLAYGHPFLDGNGRTIMTVHSVLAQLVGYEEGRLSRRAHPGNRKPSERPSRHLPETVRARADCI